MTTKCGQERKVPLSRCDGEGGMVRCVDGKLSDSRFFAEIVASNSPVLLVDGVNDWPAISRWDPALGGFSHLKSLVGSSVVQAMVAQSGSIFYGHIRGHERVSLTLGGFIDLVSAWSGEETNVSSDLTTVSGIEEETAAWVEEGNNRKCDNSFHSELYLAQVPIFSKESTGETSLVLLMQDIFVPKYMEDPVSNINLWMSMKDSRSSTHYDPYHNLLCVVAGKKIVTLWPPSATPFLYPLPIYGEASNHSGVDFVKPDLKAHPCFKDAISCSQAATLLPGDALFIPEGWYHQVDNVGVTIAVNIWWPSKISSALGTHMDGYLLRRVVSSLVDCEKGRLMSLVKQNKAEVNTQEIGLQNIASQHLSASTGGVESHGKASVSPSIVMEDLTPPEIQSIKVLVLSVPAISTSEETNLMSPELHHDGDPKLASPSAKDFQLEVGAKVKLDPVAEVFGTLEPSSLQRVLFVMMSQFPRTLETIFLHGLSPAAAEFITRKFEEMDTLPSSSTGHDFFQQFYSTFEDPQSVMTALLDRKEAFSALALGNVMKSYLGLNEYLSVVEKYFYCEKKNAS